MGGAIPLIIFLVVGLVVLYFLVTVVPVALSNRRAGGTPGAPEMQGDDQHDTLRYAVPAGQDPATVLAALNKHGYDAALDPDGAVGGSQVVLVSRADGGRPDQDEVRRVVDAG
ncbi:hypothetical protein [Nocardioides sp. SYSU DS0663]|uniref:hypothetical protein n=1 Tax=Nocardioides sp. SYSU DS0663 TaxID=3416445 RepID=UPI003F4C7F31